MFVHFFLYVEFYSSNDLSQNYFAKMFKFITEILCFLKQFLNYFLEFLM